MHSTDFIGVEEVLKVAQLYELLCMLRILESNTNYSSQIYSYIHSAIALVFYDLFNIHFPAQNQVV